VFPSELCRKLCPTADINHELTNQPTSRKPTDSGSSLQQTFAILRAVPLEARQRLLASRELQNRHNVDAALDAARENIARIMGVTIE
jgi:hypothetical protein